MPCRTVLRCLPKNLQDSMWKQPGLQLQLWKVRLRPRLLHDSRYLLKMSAWRNLRFVQNAMYYSPMPRSKRVLLYYHPNLHLSPSIRPRPRCLHKLLTWILLWQLQRQMPMQTWLHRKRRLLRPHLPQWPNLRQRQMPMQQWSCSLQRPMYNPQHLPSQ